MQVSTRDGQTAHVFEASVAIFLVAIAVLWRENPDFRVPQVHYALGVLLTVNLTTSVALRLGRGGPWLPAAATVADCAAISAVVAYSGGHASALWVLYLMPLYSACLLLEGHVVAWVAGLTAACDAATQILEPQTLPSEAWFTTIVHAGVLITGTLALWRLVSRHRAAMSTLDGERRIVAGLAERMGRQEHELEDSRQIADVGLLSGGIVHDLRTPLAVIQGYAGLLAQPGRLPADALEDLQRIQRSLKHCLAVLARFSDFSRGHDITLSECRLEPVLRAAAARAAPAFARRACRLELGALPPALPPAMASAAHLERALGILFEISAELCPAGSMVNVSAECAAAEEKAVWIDIMLAVPVPVSQASAALAPLQGHPNAPRAELSLAREIVLKHDGSIALRDGVDGGSVLTISIGVHPR